MRDLEAGANGSEIRQSVRDILLSARINSAKVPELMAWLRAAASLMREGPMLLCAPKSERLIQLDQLISSGGLLTGSLNGKIKAISRLLSPKSVQDFVVPVEQEVDDFDDDFYDDDDFDDDFDDDDVDEEDRFGDGSSSLLVESAKQGIQLCIPDELAQYFTDDQLKLTLERPVLRNIELLVCRGCCQVTEAALGILAQFPKLTWMELNGAQISANAVREFKNKTRRHLFV